MKRGWLIFSGFVAATFFGLGLWAAYGLHKVSYESGWLNSSTEWYRHVNDIETQLKRGETALVGDYKLTPEKTGKRIRVAKRAP
jgi:hypothetical protein